MNQPTDYKARQIAANPLKSVVVTAPAGSGKTSILLKRFLACLCRVERPEQVLALTFTNMAANEIRARILGVIEAAKAGMRPEAEYEIELFELGVRVLNRSNEQDWDLDSNPARLRVMTFDSFASQMASRAPLMSGMGGGQVQEDANVLYRQAVIDLFAMLDDESTPVELVNALEACLSFSKNQTELLVPMFSALLAKRDQWVEGVAGMDVEEMESVVRDSVIGHLERAVDQCESQGIRDFIACVLDAAPTSEKLDWAKSWDGSLNFYTDSGREIMGNMASLILTNTGSFRKKVTATQGFKPKMESTLQMNELLSSVQGGNESLRSSLEAFLTLPDLDFDEDVKSLCRHMSVVGKYLLAGLRIVFEQTGKLDFTEVALRARMALYSDEAGYGDSMLEEDRIQHLLVDEVQDTSLGQFKTLEMLCADWGEEGDGRSLFFCGDSAQSIYLFRGANVSLFAELVVNQRFAGKRLSAVSLTDNFRSQPENIEWVNGAFRHIFPSEVDLETGAVPYTESVASKTGVGQVNVHAFAGDPRQEPPHVVSIIEEFLEEAGPDKTLAVLVRNKKHIGDLVPLLNEKGIKFSAQGIDPIRDNPCVADVLGLIRALWHEGDRAAWFTFIRAPFVGLSWEDCLALASRSGSVKGALWDGDTFARLTDDGRQRVARVRAVLAEVSENPLSGNLCWAAKATWLRLGGASCIDAFEKADINAIFSLLEQHLKGGQIEDVRRFDMALNRLFSTPSAGRVNIMTIHKSKGLEFDSVIVMGIGESGAKDLGGLFVWRRMPHGFVMVPASKNKKDESAPSTRLYKYFQKLNLKEAESEKDRLLYVACTRAKSALHIVGTAISTESGAQPKGNTLLERLWPAVGAEFVGVNPVYLDQDLLIDIPKSQIFDIKETPDHKSVFYPSVLNQMAPTEAVQDAELDESGNLLEKAEGTAYHSVIDYMCKRGVDDVEAFLRDKQSAVLAMLRRAGYPEPEVQAGVAKILKLVEATVSGTNGRWLLDQREQAMSEVTVVGYLDRQWRKYILDRAFEVDGTPWIVDYKTSSPATGQSEEAFASKEVARYKDKMQLYGDAFKQVTGSSKVVLALYFPVLDRLERVIAA